MQKSLEKGFLLVLSVLLAFAVCAAAAVPAFAADAHPGISHGTKGGASVSEEVDTAQNTDPSMGTMFCMYLEPDAITVVDTPKMGDNGIEPTYLLMAAICCGVAYLCCNAYAGSTPRRRKNAA